jgi:hypothetical protein
MHSDTKRQPPVSRWDGVTSRPFAPGAAGLVPAGQGPTGEKSSLNPAPLPPPAQEIVYRVNGGGWRYCHNDRRVVGVTIFTDGAIVARTGYNYDYVYEEHGYSSSATANADMDSATSSAPSSILPCEPQIVSLQGIDYYLCGSQYYVQVYGIDGWMYVPVSSPTAERW